MKSISFSDKTITWFYLYLTNRAFCLISTVFLEAETINCRVHQGYILGPLLFLLYINDILQALSSIHKNLHGGDTSIFCLQKHFPEMENVLNKEFVNVCDWFVDDKLSVHFGEDKIKYILFSRDKNLPVLNITYNNNRVKQNCMVEYLSCCLGECMAMKSFRKTTTKLQFLQRQMLQFLYRQNEFLNPNLRRLLYNSLIQPYF